MGSIVPQGHGQSPEAQLQPRLYPLNTRQFLMKVLLHLHTYVSNQYVLFMVCHLEDRFPGGHP